jgi:hypothetical protein
MKKPLLSQMKIPATESKRVYFKQMEEMRKRRARQLEGRELDICIKEIYGHMTGIELKEEEELREHE